MFLSTRWNQSNTFCSWFGYDWELYYNFVIYHVITQRYQFHRQKSIIYLLLLLCDDIETCPDPAGLVTVTNNFSRSEGLKLFHLNIRGLQGNFNESRERVAEHKNRYLGLTEIFLGSNSLMDFDFPGYSFIRRDRVSGTCNRADLDWSHTKEIKLVSLFRNLQTTWLIKEPLQGFLNQPNSRIRSCNQLWDNYNGDLNLTIYDYLVKTNHKEIKELLKGFKQLLQSPTRMTLQSSTLIDVVLTNKPINVSNSAVINASLSDLISCVRKMNSSRYEPEIITCRLF